MTELSSLPGGVFCITVENLIDDIDALEQYLAEYPTETERCLPIALRNMLSPAAETLGFPPMKIPSPGDTMNLLRRIWNVEKKQKDYVLSSAVFDGLTYLLPYLFARGVSIPVRGNTLHGAAASNNIDMVKMLIVLTNDPSLRKDILGTAMMRGGIQCAPDVIDALLSPITVGKINLPEMVLREMPELLADAAANSCTDVLKVILSHAHPSERDAWVDRVPPGPKDSPLTYATGSGKLDNVQYLLSMKADIHGQNESALNVAATEGYTDIVKVLLDAKANPNARGGETLAVAAENGYDEIVKILLDAKANPSARGGEILSGAAESGTPQTIKYLLAAGADIHANGDNALITAVTENNIDGARTLLDAKADVNVITAEHFPVTGNDDMRNLLYEYGIQIDESEDDE